MKFSYTTFSSDHDGCETCTKVLEELENIDDDCDKHGIKFVKTKDFSVADGYGVHDYPALVYFESGIPNVFEGKLHIHMFNNCNYGITIIKFFVHYHTR